MLQCCLFVSTACSGLIQLVCYWFMASYGSFSSCWGENHPHPKSSRNIDLDKLRCTTSCQIYKTDLTFSMLFSGFASQLLTFATNTKDS